MLQNKNLAKLGIVTTLATRSFQAYPLTSSQIRELKAAFSMLDKNKDGRVNETEIKCMLDKLGIVLTDTMVGKLIDQASKRGDRLLNEEEFLAWMSHQSVQDDVMADLMAAFRVFDKDRNGYITRDELRTAMETIGEPMSEEQLDLMIRATDIDNDGRINYEGYLTLPFQKRKERDIHTFDKPIILLPKPELRIETHVERKLKSQSH
ncbi:calcium-binding protein E63-1 [Caerostris extrusa]|uniref:Calcium-binding protein E63-1 n=1 Tax=Caerostris extrusa TaxID=172846 RepID=A0AAV4W9R9_CAEEX|nr:calcium-binding protein E63-1 [Caerostris extrusa]